MLYMFHGGLQKPDNMTNEEFYQLWEKESEAALELMNNGMVKAAYKVAGAPEVIAIFEVPDVHDLDNIILNLPIWKLGCSHLLSFVKWTPLRDYSYWYNDLKQLAHPND